MLSSVEQAFVGRDGKRAPLKTPAWEATVGFHLDKLLLVPAAFSWLGPGFFPTSPLSKSA